MDHACEISMLKDTMVMIVLFKETGIVIWDLVSHVKGLTHLIVEW